MPGAGAGRGEKEGRGQEAEEELFPAAGIVPPVEGFRRTSSHEGKLTERLLAQLGQSFQRRELEFPAWPTSFPFFKSAGWFTMLLRAWRPGWRGARSRRTWGSILRPIRSTSAIWFQSWRWPGGSGWGGGGGASGGGGGAGGG